MQGHRCRRRRRKQTEREKEKEREGERAGGKYYSRIHRGFPYPEEQRHERKTRGRRNGVACISKIREKSVRVGGDSARHWKVEKIFARTNAAGIIEH